MPPVSWRPPERQFPTLALPEQALAYPVIDADDSDPEARVSRTPAEVFRRCRERFGEKRKDGARKLRGCGAAAAGRLWSVRDRRQRIS